MTLTQKLGIYAGIILLLLGGYNAWAWKIRADERVRIATEDATKREDFWRPIAIARKQKLKTTVVAFNKHDTTLSYIRDTLIQNKTDTVLVARFIDQAVSTVAACRAVVLTCGETVLAQDSVIAALRDINKGIKKQSAGIGNRIGKAALWAAIGFGIGNIVTNHRR